MPSRRLALPAAGSARARRSSGSAVPLPTDGPTAQFLGVQGNVARPGLDFNAERRQVLDNHVAATLKAQADVDAGRAPRPDLVVWPENASDIDPLRNADAKDLILETVDALEAAAHRRRPARGARRVRLQRGAALRARQGQHRPLRQAPPGALRRVHPEPVASCGTSATEVDLVTRDFVQGPAPGVFRVTTASGQQIRAGLAICFEVAYDDIMRDAVQAGANVLVVQTNNATFGYTAESPQQLAISRLRAMEFGRSVVHVSTVGQSALITPDGTAHQVTSLFTQAVVRGALPLRDATTLATRVGEAPEWVAAAALLTMLALGLRADAARPAVPETTKEEDDDDAA